jgi:hypothetical protein
MHVYPTRKIQKLNHMHASLDRNLPKLVRLQLQAFKSKIKEEGYIFKRVPSIDLEPIDKEAERHKERYKMGVFKRVCDQMEKKA